MTIRYKDTAWKRIDDGRTDGQTDRRTDGQTDGHPESIGPQPLGLGPKNIAYICEMLRVGLCSKTPRGRTGRARSVKGGGAHLQYIYNRFQKVSGRLVENPRTSSLHNILRTSDGRTDENHADELLAVGFGHPIARLDFVAASDAGFKVG